MRLYIRDEITELKGDIVTLMQELLVLMKENTDTVMPGFTHLQKAQPVTFAHHTGAYFEMFKRDLERLSDIYERMNYCPLGAVRLQEQPIRLTESLLQDFSASRDLHLTVWILYLTEIILSSFCQHFQR